MEMPRKGSQVDDDSDSDEIQGGNFDENYVENYMKTFKPYNEN